MHLRSRFAALALVPLALAGCGSSGSGGGTTGGSQQNVAANLVELCKPGENVDKNAFVNASQQSSDKAKTGHVTGTLSLPMGTSTSNGTIEADLDTSDKTSPKMSMKMTVAGQDMQMLLVDKSIYVQVPGSSGKYMTMPLTDDMRASLSQMNAADSIAKYRDGINDLRCVGTEDVNGKKAAHYSYTMNLAAMMPTPSGATTPAASLPSGLAKPQPAELWIGADNLPVKATVTMDGQTSTFTYSKWGEPVTITAPAPSQVETMPALPTPS